MKKFGSFFTAAMKNIAELILSSFLAAAAAALLLVFFLTKQMQRQGSISVSHVPVFAYGAIDVFVSFAKTFAFTFRGFKWIQAAAALPAGALLLLALLRRDKTLVNLLLIFVCGWTVYYLLTACSFYGYNGTWNPNQLGTANIGGRYSLMFAPLLSLLLTYGVYCFCAQSRDSKGWLNAKKTAAAALCLLAAYSAIGLGSLLTSEKKDDIREATHAWYGERAWMSKTLVNQWDDPLFQFYLTHHRDYSEDYQTCTKEADFTLVTDICAAREPDPGDLNSGMLVEGMIRNGIEARWTPSFDDTERFLRENWKAGDLVITMGCGDINLLNDQIHRHESEKKQKGK